MSKNIKTLIFILFVLTTLLISSCNQEIKNTADKPKANVFFTLNVTPYEAGNIGGYKIQYKAIPMFGGQDTAGRQVNWTTVEHSNGKFTLPRIDTGEWTFYIRVIDSKSTLMETLTGTKNVLRDLVIILDEENPDLTGYGNIDIYVRVDYVDDRQTIKVSYENTKTGTTYELDNVEWNIVKKNKSYFDYTTTSDLIPAGNYIFRFEVYDQLGDVVMTREEAAVIRSTYTDPIILKMRLEGLPGVDVDIDDKSKYLEGVITGIANSDINKIETFTYHPLNEYTKDNAVWYFWHVDGKRYSSQEPYLEVSFSLPGSYLISCSPIGINGEVSKNGSSVHEIKINTPSSVGPDGNKSIVVENSNLKSVEAKGAKQ